MMFPKVPYLQYEILEYFHLKPDKSLSTYVGYSEDGKIVKSGIKKLTEKALLTSDFKLTETGLHLVTKYLHSRFNHPDYSKVTLKNGFSTQSELFDTKVNNQNGNVFRWYKYLEDFPHEFIRNSINKYKIDSNYFILDPFVGSGTTQIQAKLDGIKSIGMDINPVMVFISKCKLNWEINIEDLKNTLSNLLYEFKNTPIDKQKILSRKSDLFNMPNRELNQWLSPVKQWEVSYMFYLIEHAHVKNDIKNIIKFITSTSALNASYVAFCPGTTFYPFRSKPDFLYEFARLSTWVLEDLESSNVQKNHKVDSMVYEYSSKETEFVKKIANKVDLIITSPPYPNDLEYTRQTRLELYALGYVKNMEDVQTLKKRMVKGSTKLIYTDDYMRDEVKNMKSILNIKLELTEKLKDKNWGFDYPKMVQQYFSDMWTCMENYRKVLVKDGTCILVVGDQTFKGVVIPVAEILAEIAEKIGFRDSKIELHRNRRSTMHTIPIPEENLILTK